MLSVAQIQPIVHEFKEILHSTFGERFENVILFGSYARGDNHLESDIDLLVVLRNFEGSKYKDYDKIVNKIVEFDIKYNIILSTHFTKDKFLTSPLPLYSEIRKEGKTI
jgi:uncharacterized protein